MNYMIFEPFYFLTLNMLQHDFFPKLVNIFRVCEALKNVNALHMIFRLVKGISMSYLLSMFMGYFILLLTLLRILQYC
jgi:protein phosphatase 4 regulatory subunit 3